jgi:hypothetical protein
VADSGEDEASATAQYRGDSRAGKGAGIAGKRVCYACLAVAEAEVEQRRAVGHRAEPCPGDGTVAGQAGASQQNAGRTSTPPLIRETFTVAARSDGT